MTGLLKNELIKSGKQTGHKVYVIIVAVIATIVVIGCGLINKYLPGFFIEGMFGTEEQYQKLLQYAENEEENGWYAEAWDDRTQAEVIGFFLEHDLDGTWKQTYCQYEYEELYRKMAFCRLMATESEKKDRVVSDPECEYYVPSEYLNGNGTVNLTFNYQKEYGVLKGEVEEYQTYILELEPDRLYESLIRSYESSSEDIRAEIKAFEGEKDSAEYRRLEATDAGNQIMLRGLRYLLDNKISPDDWRSVSVTNQLYTILNQQTEAEAYQSEKEFNESGTIGDYKHYLEANEKMREQTADAVEIVLYSIEEGIPLDENATFISAQNAVVTGMSFFGAFFTILLVIIAAHTITSEFSSGTIRLLVIRPKKRYKIWLSKLMTLGILSVCAYLVMFVVAFFASMALYGPSALLVPHLSIMGGAIVEVPAILHLLSVTGLCLLESWLLTSLTFLLATLFTKSGLSTTLGILILMFGGTLQNILLLTRTVFGFSRGMYYTIFTNLSLTDRFGSPQKILSVGAEQYYHTISPNILINVLIVAVHIALFAGLACYAFSRKQIKN